MYLIHCYVFCDRMDQILKKSMCFNKKVNKISLVFPPHTGDIPNRNVNNHLMEVIRPTSIAVMLFCGNGKQYVTRVLWAAIKKGKYLLIEKKGQDTKHHWSLQASSLSNNSTRIKANL